MRNTDINFLFEMGNLRLIKRMWSRFYDGFANVAEHHFRVFWIAMIIASNEKNVDTGRIAKLALLHDITESRTGDVDYLSRQYVKRNEKLAIEDILSDTSLEKEFYELWEEYEKRETIEAKIVKDADNLDIDFELVEATMSGSNSLDQWKDIRKTVKTKLYTETAHKIFDQLQHTNPFDWHLSGRNRINDGDWKDLVKK